MTREDLIEEIIANARRDRKRLEAVADGLVNNFAKVPTPDQAEDPAEFDPEIAAAFAEEIAHVGDSLTRVNQQLVELVKTETKAKKAAPGRLSPEEVESAYEAILPEEAN